MTGGNKCEEGAGGRRDCVTARGCTYMAKPHVALGESWQVHVYGEAAEVFFFPPHSPLEQVHLYGEATHKNWGAVLLYSLVCGMTNQGWARGGWRGAPIGEAARCVHATRWASVEVDAGDILFFSCNAGLVQDMVGQLLEIV